MQHKTSATKNRGRINLNKEMPEDLMATNSKFSPSFPNVIIEDNKIAMGNASVTKVALAYTKNFPSVSASNPLPTRSSIYFHKVCIIKTNRVIKNVTMKGPIKALRMSLSNFLITVEVYLTL